MLVLYDCTFSSRGRRWPHRINTRKEALDIVRREGEAAEDGFGSWDFAIYDIREEADGAPSAT